MKISIIILTKNNGRTIEKVLQQIKHQQIDADVETIVVDSGSSDDTIDKISRYNVKLHTIPPGDFGHGRTRNLASGYAGGDYFVYLSADAIPAGEHWLENLVAPLASDDVGAAFGRQIPYEDASPMERFFILRNYPSKKNPDSIDDFNMNAFFSNVNSAIKRHIWNDLKFNESLIISEDYDWAKRARESGYKTEYVPDAAVYHSHKYGLKQVFKRYFDSGVSFSQMGLKPVFLKNGLQYFMDEMRYVGKESVFRIPYAIFYDIFKMLGFMAGNRHKWIPMFIKRHLSMHSYFWRS